MMKKHILTAAAAITISMVVDVVAAVIMVVLWRSSLQSLQLLFLCSTYPSLYLFQC